jgi:pilin isopeptide linkage protein/LPXTG-motif cell wall-anchored protein
MYANRYIYSIEEFSAIEHRVLVGDNTYNVISKKDIPGQFGLITFTNAYVAPNSCKVSIPVHKIVSGDLYKLNEGDFSFLLKGPGVETEVSNNSLGYAVFPEITFSKEGAYTYTLSEVKGSIPNITYDNSQYTITVYVKHNPVSNCLEAKLSFLKNGTAFDGGIPVFINSHSQPEPVDPPKPSYPTLYVPITGHKVFEHGRLKGGDFTFILKDKDGQVLAEATNQKDGSFTFPDRTFSLEVQNYTFTVHEAPGRDSGIVYDNAVYTIKVTTRAVGGHLEATVDVFKDGAPYTGTITFTNCPAVPPTGDNTPAVVLTLAGLGALALLAYLYLKRRKKH